jgi:hypothetical protein
VVVASSAVTAGNVAPTITTSHEGPVSSDAALAQLAAEAGLLEGGDGTMIQVKKSFAALEILRLWMRDSFFNVKLLSMHQSLGNRT